MSSKGPALTYRRLRAPRSDGELLIEPAWSECVTQAIRNRESLAAQSIDVLGRSQQELRSTFRKDLIRLAREHCAEYATSAATSPLISVDDDRPIIMSGHQPRLFHPGVWAKNFAAAELAKLAGGIAMHVIIDNDAMREHSIRVPTGSIYAPFVASEAFDQFSEPIPFEMREAKDLEVLDSFPARVAARVEPFVSEPLVHEIWPHVTSAVRSREADWTCVRTSQTQA